jgi:hypothetical protein
MGKQRLTKESEAIGEDRWLTSTCLSVCSVHAKEVAQIQQLGQLPPGFAHLLLADHYLDTAGQVRDLFASAFRVALDFPKDGPTGPIFEIQEVDLAAITATDDTTGDADTWALRFR